MRKLIDGYCRLLTWLMVATVALLVVPVSLQIVSNLFVLIFALVFVYWGIKFVEFGWYQESELAELPMPFIFVAWPLAGVTWVIFLGEIFFDNIRIVAGKTAP